MVGWITSISVIAIVPIDVWVTLTDGDTRSLAVMWLICYWCATLPFQALCVAVCSAFELDKEGMPAVSRRLCFVTWPTWQVEKLPIL